MKEPVFTCISKESHQNLSDKLIFFYLFIFFHNTYDIVSVRKNTSRYIRK